MKAVLFILLAPLVFTAASAFAQAEAPAVSAPADTQKADKAALMDRLSTSLIFRGETADRLIEAGMAPTVINTAGLESYSDLRLAMLAWIKKNPGKAADLAIYLDNGGIRPGETRVYRQARYEINEVFLAKVKALNAAAGDAGMPAEGLEAAARRLYEGGAAGDGDPVVNGAGAGRGSSFFSGGYADYRLNRAGLAREVAGAGSMLESLRGPSGRGPAGAEAEYAAALKRYAAFVVASSDVKNRKVVTAAESAALEEGRARLRRALAAITIAAVSAETDAAAGRLSGSGLAAEAARLRERLRELTALAAGEVPLGDLSAIVAEAETAYYSFFLKCSVYGSADSLARRAGALGYSCLYDYLLNLGLARLFPAAEVLKARRRAYAGAATAGAIMKNVEAGDMAAALSGPGLKSLGADLRAVEKYSAFNRAAQFFNWGLLLRPIELNVTVRGGRARLSPEITFYSIMAGRRAARAGR